MAVQRRGCYKSLIWILNAESTYLLGCGVDKLSLQSSRTGLMHSAVMSVRRQPVRSAFVDWFLPLWAFSPFEDLQAPMVLTGTLRKWNPCGTASSSVHPILSVCVCHPLSPRVTSYQLYCQAGALSTPWQTQCNEAMPWSGKHGLITRVYLQQFGTVEHAVQFALFVSMVLHATYPSNHFLSATFSSRASCSLSPQL